MRRGLAWTLVVLLVGAAATSGCDEAVEEAVCLDEPTWSEADREPFRPRLAYTPAAGWMNDPNGLIFFGGQYHLFFQHNPDLTLWGNIHWGHAVSPDLLHWETLPVALAPSDELGMVFSGSAVLDRYDSVGQCDGAPCLTLVFTHSGGADRAQKQSIATSVDGRTFVEYPHNPVLANPGLDDFRDPKVVRDEARDRWVMVVSASNAARFYASDNLTDWTLLSTFGPRDDLPDGPWECPDLFPLEAPDGGVRWVLKLDVLHGLMQGGESYVFIGDFDGETFTPQDDARRLDHGMDFYAAHSFSEVEQRHVWIAWRDSWAYALVTPTDEWRGAMTTPREVRLVERAGRLSVSQRPVAEVNAARMSCPLVSLRNAAVAEVSAAVSDVREDTLDIELDLDPNAVTEVALALLTAEGQQSVLTVDLGNKRLSLDRSTSGEVGFSPLFGEAVVAPLAVTGPVDLRVLVDRTSVEVFAEDGTVALTASVYPRGGSSELGLALWGEGVIARFEAYRLR